MRVATPETTLADALDLLDRKLALLPVKGKLPNHEALAAVFGETSWRRFADRPLSRPELEAILRADPESGIAVLCGEPSRVVVVDVDVPSSLGRLVRSPPTPTVRSGGGGTHLYVAGSVPGRKLPGIGDLKGTGGYVVAPPSPGYEWLLRLGEVELVALAEVSGLDLSLGDGPKDEVLRPMALVSTDGNRRTTTGVESLVSNSNAVIEMLRVLRIPVSAIEGRKFRCPMPRHDDRRPSATLVRGFDEIFRVRCWAGCAGDAPLTLAEVAASRAAGDAVRLRGPSQARWYRRLEADAALVAVEKPPMPGLPSNAPEPVRRVAEGFAFLVGVRRSLDAEDRGTPFGRKFAAAWCGVTEKQARDATIALKDLDVIRPIGKDGPMILWTPGTGDPRRIVRAAAAREARRRSA